MELDKKTISEEELAKAGPHHTDDPLEGMTEQERQKYDLMINTPIPKLINKLALPSIGSMLISSVYNMADTYFVGQLGTSASAAIGLVFPMMLIIQAVGMTFGAGGGSYISRLMGQKKNEEASKVLTTSLTTAFALGLALMLVGVSNTDAIMRILGASDSNIGFASDYARYIFYGAPFMAASFVLNNSLRSEGSSNLSIFGIGFGGVLNMVLDPIFIFDFGFGLGTAGAAIATSISQAASFAILLGIYVTKKSVLRVKPSYFTPRFSLYKEIFRTGTATFLRQGTGSVANVLLNTAAGNFGDVALASISICNRVLFLFGSLVMGITQGMQPVVGFNYSAKRYDRMMQAYWYNFKTAAKISVGVTVIVLFAAPTIISVFRNDPAVIEYGGLYLRLQMIGLFGMCWSVTNSMTFQALGRAGPATFLAFARQGICLIPIVLILPNLLGVYGVFMSQPLADVLAALITLPLAIGLNKEIRQKQAAMEMTEIPGALAAEVVVGNSVGE